MSEQDNQGGDLAKRTESSVPSRRIRLSSKDDELDLSGLSTSEADALEVYANRKIIDRDDSKEKIKHDLAATNAKLGIYAERVQQANSDGNAVTIKNESNDSLGKTQIVMGNTETAWQGGTNWKAWIIIATIVGVAFVMIAAFKAMGGN